MSTTKIPKSSNNLYYVKVKPVDWKTLEENYKHSSMEEEEIGRAHV